MMVEAAEVVVTVKEKEEEEEVEEVEEEEEEEEEAVMRTITLISCERSNQTESPPSKSHPS